MTYTFTCPDHGETELDIKLSDYSPTQFCECGKEMERVYSSIGIKWNCSGDYNSTR